MSVMTSKHVMDSTSNNEESIEKMVETFEGLLLGMTGASEKHRRLWKEIYKNALIDRWNANALFMTLVSITGDKSTEHAIHGKTLATYVERMSRANDQLIKLSEIISSYEEKQESLDPEEMYEKLKTS